MHGHFHLPEALTEFLLQTADHLQLIHQLILKLILHLLNRDDEIWEGPEYSKMDYVRMIHVFLLNCLHFYLIYQVLGGGRVKLIKSKWLSGLQWIALVISMFDWLCIDLLNILHKNKTYPWFAYVGYAMLVLHFAPIVILLMRKCPCFQPSLVKYHKILDDREQQGKIVFAWEVSYAVFSGVFLVASSVGTVPYVAKLIQNSFPEVDAPGYRIASILLLLYTIIVFYVVFPRITNQYNRPFSWFSFAFMGLIMGVIDALCLSMAYQLATQLLGLVNIYAQFFVTLLAYMLPTAYYYAAIFNPKLAPEHRRPEWDLFKILSLTVSDILVVMFAVYYCGFFLVFVVQMLVLAGIVSSMRFPSPWYQGLESPF